MKSERAADGWQLQSLHVNSLTADQIRSCFVNCSKGEAKRLNLPTDLSATRWDDLDFLGWADPQSPRRHYVVTPVAGSPVGVVLRSSSAQTRRTTMCDVCLTTHPAGGVTLMVAPLAGAAGRSGNTVGIPLCTDLQCSLYIRGLKKPILAGQVRDSHDPLDQIARLQRRLNGFVTRISTS